MSSDAVIPAFAGITDAWFVFGSLNSAWWGVLHPTLPSMSWQASIYMIPIILANALLLTTNGLISF